MFCLKGEVNMPIELKEHSKEELARWLQSDEMGV